MRCVGGRSKEGGRIDGGWGPTLTKTCVSYKLRIQINGEIVGREAMRKEKRCDQRGERTRTWEQATGSMCSLGHHKEVTWFGERKGEKKA